MTRRLGLFVTAMQLGCSYSHTPLFEMNANSAKHGVPAEEGDSYFGLGTGCRRRAEHRGVGQAHISRATGRCQLAGMIGTSEPRWTARLFDSTSYSASDPALDAASTETIRAAHSLLATRVSAWRKKHSNGMACEYVVVETQYGIPAALDRCKYLKALATLRARYEEARGTIQLPWFEVPPALGCFNDCSMFIALCLLFTAFRV